jgi:hypothetical protein
VRDRDLFERAVVLLLREALMRADDSLAYGTPARRKWIESQALQIREMLDEFGASALRERANNRHSVAD